MQRSLLLKMKGECLVMLALSALTVQAVPRLTVDWEAPQTVDRGDYPRMRVLADGRYALV